MLPAKIANTAIITAAALVTTPAVVLIPMGLSRDPARGPGIAPRPRRA
jgi:hypothetical protein